VEPQLAGYASPGLPFDVETCELDMRVCTRGRFLWLGSAPHALSICAITGSASADCTPRVWIRMLSHAAVSRPAPTLAGVSC
jgi:hypothetical protein